MLGYLSLDIICSSKLTVFFFSQTVRFSEQIMFADKYTRIFSRQVETIVHIFPNFQSRACCEKDLKDNKHNSLHLTRKYARIFVSLDIICSSKLTDIMSANKYPSIFSRQMETTVYVGSPFRKGRSYTEGKDNCSHTNYTLSPLISKQRFQ